MFEPLIVEALTSVGFNHDDDMTEVGQLKHFRCPLFALKVARKKGILKYGGCIQLCVA
jgi:hypothetical protein